jgi:Fe-S cluster biogenesis protein NfuA
MPSGSSSVEFTSAREALRKSRLAAELFAIEGVSSVYFGPDFISVNKRPESLWIHIKPAVFSAIMDQFSMHANEPIINESANEDADANDTLNVKEDDSETVKAIKEILSERIRPVVQGDGGDIEFKGFTPDGVVKLRLQGACRSCASSTLTLKNGIENMLKFYVAEVKAVEQVEDEAEQVAKAAFEKFEHEHHKPKE